MAPLVTEPVLNFSFIIPKMVTCKLLEYLVYFLVCVSTVSAIKVIKSPTSSDSQVSSGGAEILDSNLSGLDVFTLCMNVKTLQFTNKFQTLLYLPSDFSLLPLLIGTTPASCDDWLISVIPGNKISLNLFYD